MPRKVLTVWTEASRSQEQQFHNPWQCSEGFLYLGAVDSNFYGPERRYELYSLNATLWASTVTSWSVGARFGNREHEYVSGGSGLFRDMGIYRDPEGNLNPVCVAARANILRRLGFKDGDMSLLSQAINP